MATRTTSAWMLALALAGGALAANQARATSVSRCATSDGAAAYTDGSCSGIGAQPAPMSLALARRLARTQGTASDESPPVRPGGEPGGVDAGFATGSGRAPAFAGCPRTADQLQVAFEQSLASGDVNRLAAVYDWTNVSGRQSRDLLQRLERMSHSRMQDAGFAGSVRRRAGCLLFSL